MAVYIGIKGAVLGMMSGHRGVKEPFINYETQLGGKGGINCVSKRHAGGRGVDRSVM